MKSRILFFSRAAYYRLFTELPSDQIDGYHLVVTRREKRRVLSNGGKVAGCFEEEYDGLPIEPFPRDYLRNGFQPDRFLGECTLHERHQVLGKQIAFLRKIFNDRDYDAVVHETISMELEEVLSIEAARHDVLDLNFLPSVVDGFFYWKPDPYSSSFPEEMIAQAEPSPAHRSEAAKHIAAILEKGHYPDYLDVTVTTHAPSNAWRHLAHMMIDGTRRIKNAFKDGDSLHREKLDRLLFYFRDQTNQLPIEKLIDTAYILLGQYDHLSKIDEWPFVFYPLHLEPEATLRYFSPQFSNQKHVIDLIARNLPMDRMLVVKEHPSQPHYLLRQEYQSLRRANSNLLYLPADVPSELLIHKSQMVATVTGTIGWEALIYERPVIAFGDVFYDKHPGLTKVESPDALRRALRAEVNSPQPPEVSEDYIARILSYAHKGRLYRDYWNNAENIEKIREAIISQLSRSSTHQCSPHVVPTTHG